MGNAKQKRTFIILFRANCVKYSIILILLTLFIISGNTFAQETEQGQSASITVPEKEESPQVRKINIEIDAVQKMIEGKLSDVFSIEELLGIDITKNVEVKKQIQALQAQIKAAIVLLKKLENGESVGEEIDKDLVSLGVDRDKLKIELLKLSLQKRKALFDAELEKKKKAFATQIEQLQFETKALQQLIEGQLPEGFEIRKLFEVDITDEQAVKNRIELLQKRVQKKNEENRQKHRKNKKPSPVTESNGPEDLQSQVEQFRLERDKLRLQFLQLPMDKRRSLLDADEKRKRIAEQEAAAEKARLEAELAEREAEAARQAALEQERQAATELEKAFAGERARIEQAKAALAAMQGDLAGEQQRFANISRNALQRQDAFRQRMAEPGFNANAADQLYKEVVGVLTQDRLRLREAMKLLDKPSRISPYQPGIDLSQPPYSNAEERRSEIISMLEELQYEEKRLIDEELQKRWAHTVEMSGDVKRLNALRLEILPHLSEGKRSSVLGLTREGFSQLLREVDQVQLMTNFYLRERLAMRSEIPKKLTDVFTVGAAGVRVLEVLFLLLVFLYLRRHYQKPLQALLALVLGRSGDQQIRILFHRWLGFLVSITPDLGVLFFVYLLFGAIDAEDVPEVALIRTVVIAYAWYRLSLSVPLHVVTGAALSHRVKVSPELSDRILRSLRTVMRYIYPVFVFLILSDRVLGKGFLYQIVVKFAWIGAFPIAIMLIRHWRPDINIAYLNYYPKGKLRRTIEQTTGKWTGFFVAIPAFVLVAIKGVNLYISDSLVHFRHTRKAFAYMFRRRLEKQAETVGNSTTDINMLPDELKEAFSEGPASAELAVDYYPYLDRTLALIENWQKTGQGTAIALVGENGIGKTSWLNELQRKIGGISLKRMTIDDDAHSKDRVFSWLKVNLQDTRSGDLNELVSSVNAGTPSLFLIDQCQNFILRAVNGMTGFDAFMDFISQTEQKSMWICAFSRYAWEYIESVYQAGSIFREIYRLGPWSEKNIDTLISHRMDVAGFKASYEDLIVDRVEGTQFENEVIRTGDRYRQLLWDYSDGIPRVALHFWLRSLIHGGDQQVKVRLFADPSPDELENVNEQSRFILAAVVIHENLTLADATRSLNFSAHSCETALNYLCARGVLKQTDGRFRVTSHWHRAVVRYLRRKHLLYS